MQVFSCGLWAHELCIPVYPPNLLLESSLSRKRCDGRLGLAFSCSGSAGHHAWFGADATALPFTLPVAHPLSNATFAAGCTVPTHVCDVRPAAQVPVISPGTHFGGNPQLRGRSHSQQLVMPCLSDSNVVFVRGDPT
jgi:hypothetical protein